MEFPIVKIDGMTLIDNYFDDGVNTWRTLTLIEHSKKYEPFDLPLACIDLSSKAFGNELSYDDFIYHLSRINKTDLQYPILLDKRGIICDGWHRVCKAIIEGRATVKAIRFSEMPEPDGLTQIEK